MAWFSAFFRSGRFKVTVTTPAPFRVTSIASIAGDHTDGMGMNPYRKHVRRPTDYLFVGLAVVACVVLVAWGFFG
jgi:hypothetical protein